MGLGAFGPCKVGADSGQDTGKQTDHSEANRGCLGAAENCLRAPGEKSIHCTQNNNGEGNPVRKVGEVAFTFGVEPGKATTSLGFFGYQGFKRVVPCDFGFLPPDFLGFKFVLLVKWTSI